MLSEPVVFSWHDRCCTNPHELCEKFIHPAFSYFAAVLLRWLGGRRVLLDTCKLFRTCPQTCRCPCGRHSNQSNSSAGTIGSIEGVFAWHGFLSIVVVSLALFALVTVLADFYLRSTRLHSAMLTLRLRSESNFA